jgi:hypothetical protein
VTRRTLVLAPAMRAGADATPAVQLGVMKAREGLGAKEVEVVAAREGEW